MEIKLTTNQRNILILIASIFVTQLFILAIGTGLIRYIFDDYHESGIIKIAKISLQINLQILGLIIQLLYKYIILYIKYTLLDSKPNVVHVHRNSEILH